MDRYYIIILISMVVLAGRVSGLSLSYVSSGSMEPGVKKSDLVIVVPVRQIQKGDIILFTQNDKKILHRVDSINNTSSTTTFQTKGDHNPDVDQESVIPKEILGKVIIVLPTHQIIRNTNLPLLFWIIGFCIGILLFKIFCKNTHNSDIL